MNEDPLWARIKAQTKQLANRRSKKSINEEAYLKPKQYPERPIWDADFATPKSSAKAKKTNEPVRTDAHQRVRRGRVEVDYTLDLHGFSEIDAKTKLLNTLLATTTNKTILVITGKGERGNGVLRTALPNWLKTPEFSNLVYGFAQAHKRHGGDGAWYVFLRKVS